MDVIYEWIPWWNKMKVLFKKKNKLLFLKVNTSNL